MKRYFAKLKEKKGFSLIEAICSIAVFAIATVTIISAVMFSSKMMIASKKQDKDKQIMSDVVAIQKIILFDKNGRFIEEHNIPEDDENREVVLSDGSVIYTKDLENASKFTINYNFALDSNGNPVSMVRNVDEGQKQIPGKYVCVIKQKTVNGIVAKRQYCVFIPDAQPIDP